MVSKKHINKERTDYQKKKPFNYKKFFLIFFGVILLLVLSYLSFNSFNKISGKTILSLEADYQESRPLKGFLRLSLKQGELIPASSKIVVNNAGVEKKYNLNEFVLNDVVEGNFYTEGKSLTGYGQGYGIAGTKEIYPVVSFTLNIFSETKKTEKEEEKVETKTKEEKIDLDEVDAIEEEPEVEEQKIIEETEVVEEKPKKEKEEKDKETKKEKEPEEIEEETDFITGNIIGALFSKVSNLFLGLTGKVSMEIETEINGEVSKDRQFVYNLEEGKTAEIVSSSYDVDMNIKGENIVVTTDYVEYEKGFGREYIGDFEEEIIIDLSKLNLSVHEGEMMVSLVYNNEEIISLTANLAEGLVNGTSEKKMVLNQTVLNKSEIIETLPSVLSDEEKEVLVNKFGNVPLKLTKAEVFNERLIIRYELGNLWIEYSYDYSEDFIDKINSQVEEDGIKWLKDLAYRFSHDETASEEIANMTKEIKIFE